MIYDSTKYYSKQTVRVVPPQPHHHTGKGSITLDMGEMGVRVWSAGVGLRPSRSVGCQLA